MGVAFVPVYIRYLGIEAYGVIGFFATLQAVLVLLDLGMTPTLLREVARFTGGKGDVMEVRDLLRSVEIVAAGVAIVIATLVWCASDWLASSWFRVEALPAEQLRRALGIMGIVAALRFVEGIYRSALLGLQQQVAYNGIAALMSSVRAIGAIWVLSHVSNSVDGFFVWQGGCSIVTVAAYALTTYRCLPSGDRRGRFSVPALVSVWRFAAGMLGISLLALTLTQIDKMMLSRLLPLSDYARYMLATLVAASLETAIAPLFQALIPRFSRLHAAGDEAEFVRLYHLSAQLVTVLAGSAAVMLIGFAEPLLALWTGDPGLARHTAPLLRVLALGYLLNIFMWVPYQAQLAHRWTELTLRVNLGAIFIVVPVLVVAVPRFGAIGAAWIWVALNTGYVIINIYFMHRRILKAEKRSWYLRDLIQPMVGSTMAMLIAAALFPWNGDSRPLLVLALALSGFGSLAASILCSPLIREQLLELLRRRRRVRS